MIRIKNVTKDYGSNKGVFDLSFEVQDQETFGLSEKSNTLFLVFTASIAS